jgi:hypothetical protein
MGGEWGKGKPLTKHSRERILLRTVPRGSDRQPTLSNWEQTPTTFRKDRRQNDHTTYLPEHDGSPGESEEAQPIRGPNFTEDDVGR